MNKNKIYSSILGLACASLTVTSLTGCMEETMPTTVATEDQVQGSPSSAESFLMALPDYFNTVDAFASSLNWHAPFGYGAIMHIRDLMTGDLCAVESGYGSHFANYMENNYLGDGYVYTQYICNYYYEFVLNANNMIGAVNPDNATEKQLGYLGAGCAFRALLYLDMARMYEFLPNDKTQATNGITNLTVPIVKNNTSLEEAKNNPRATREDMAAFIEDDLNTAEKYIGYLTDTHNNILPNLACVYGLKARLYMWTEDYAKAQEYARKAINASGLSPMSEHDCLNYTTGFNDISKWMWGAQQTAEDASVKTGICNWTSWMSNQTTFGYTGYSANNMPYNMIDRSMYDRISDTDFRKLEFKAPIGSTLSGKETVIPGTEEYFESMLPSYTALKFRPNEGNYTDPNVGAASAYPIMRVEEMYFIEAEAAAHQSAPAGKTLLENFMKSYRDPQYSSKASSTEEVVDEIVFQKRVELWGEGQTFFDVKRLNMSVTRGYPGTNWYDIARFNTNGRPAWMNLVMVRTESNNNQGLIGKNNPDPSGLYTPWQEEK